MRQIGIGMIVGGLVCALGCAKAPILKRSAPGYFMGFTDVPADEARLVVWRESKVFGDAVLPLVEVNDCRFRLGINQFAVCTVDPGTVEITFFAHIETLDVEGGEWTCLEFRNRTMPPVFPPTDCRALLTELDVHRQVWTTQEPSDEILKRTPPPSPGSRVGKPRAGDRRYPPGE